MVTKMGKYASNYVDSQGQNGGNRAPISPATRADLARLGGEWAALLADLRAQLAVLDGLAATCERAALHSICTSAMQGGRYGEPEPNL